MSNLDVDLNQAITAAVNARIEAEVMKALSGDEALGRFVTAALQQKIEVKRDGYRSEKVPFLTHVLETAIREATKAAVSRLIVEEVESIEAEVRKALRRDLAKIAGTLTESLVKVAERPYGVSVNMELRMPSRD